MWCVMANLRPKIAFAILVSSFVIWLAGCGDIEGELASLNISPSGATIGISQSQLFTASGEDDLGFIVDVDPTWSVTGGIGTINSNGLFTAGASTGAGSVVASYGGKSSSASVTVTDKCWIEGRVTGEQDPGGVQNILVSLRGTSLFDRTDSGGEYSISNVAAGTYNVYTQEDHQIYNSVSWEVMVASGQTRTQNFYLTVRPGVVTTTSTTLFSP